MPRVNHVKHARKDYSQWGVKKGDSYYWWAFRYEGIHASKTYPHRSLLTQSSFLQELYGIEDDLGSLAPDSNLPSEIENIIGRIDSLRETCEDSLSNMPDNLQESSSSGQLLQERIDSLQSWSDDLSGIDINVDEDEIRENAKSEFEEWDEDQIKEDIIKELSLLDDDTDELDKELAKRKDQWEAELEAEADEKVQEAWDSVLTELQECSSNL